MDKYDFFFNITNSNFDEFFSEKNNLRLYLQKRKLVTQIVEGYDNISVAQVAQLYQYLVVSFNIIEHDIACGEGFFLNGALLTKLKWNSYPIYPSGHDLIINSSPISDIERCELIERYPFIVEKDQFENLLKNVKTKHIIKL